MNIKKYFLLLVVFLLFLKYGTCWSQTNTNEPPVITAIGNQLYCPTDNIKIATDIIILDPDDLEIEAMFVQISAGYVRNQDKLTLTGTHPNITTEWNSTTAKLKLRGVSGGDVLYTDFTSALLDIEFSTTNPNTTGDRSFSFTIGDANFLPSTGHFYEYVSDRGITWTSAKAAAELRTYFGLTGYLVTILSAEEAQISGEQSNGTGWIGGSDQQTEGVWKWVTGPEAGTVFWNGLSSGSTPNFAFWNRQEPNSAGNEDYAHIKSNNISGPSGSWNDLENVGNTDPNSNYHPQGYIVEYGGMPGDPILNISASTSIHIPKITNTVSNSKCDAGIITLEATADFGTINWFDTQSGGNLIGTGPIFITPVLNTSATYFVSAAISGCTSGLRTVVTAAINDIPTINSTNDDTLCFGGSGNLTATVSNGTINWYDSLSGGISLGTGTTFKTPVVNTTTTYYVAVSTTNCTSVRSPVVLTVQSPTRPTGNTIQYFCEKDNATISELTVTAAANIIWYDSLFGGDFYTGIEALTHGQSYFASQSNGLCESQDRLEVVVTIYNSVTPLPLSSIPIMTECDTYLDGNDTNYITTFDLTNYESILINGEDFAEFNFTYFLESGYLNQIPNPTTFENTIANTQTIYVRMTNNSDINCYTDTSFTIEVLELPATTSPSMYSQCDDTSNDGIATFNLELVTIKEEIVPNYITENINFTFYNNSTDAENGTNAIIVPSNYQNSTAFTNEIIWIRVENPTNCFRIETIELEVNPSSAALASYNPNSLFQCDDGTDPRDGISTFDLTNIRNHIETVIFPTLSVSIHFYESLTAAELENNEIINIANHLNTNSPNIQNIWVRVKSDLGNNCLGLEDFPNLLNVEALPIANTFFTSFACDDDQDGVFPFDTSNLESDILMGQELAAVYVTYFDASGMPLRDYNGGLISSPFPNTFKTISRVINYTVTNISTNDPDGACSESNSLEFIVDQLPINNTVVISPICDPDPDDGLLIGVFDTATLEVTIGAQLGMDITYFDASMNPLVDADGNSIKSPFPSTFKSGTQTINIVVTNAINASCQVTNTTDFIVDALPEFTVESSRIICESGVNSSITLEVIQDDPNEVLDYEWTDENGVFIASAKSIDIISSGIYTVTLFKTNGTGCLRSKKINVIYSEKAHLDYDDITILDDSYNNSIRINNDNQNLGKGDYEFSLDTYGPYQDEPIFENLIPGIYTVYVKDKNECGISALEVAVLGFPKFFSPNNDGENDNWQVLGISKNFYTTSTIYIYDRFGKMIVNINPLNEGWGGFYNGVMLPSDDYWFSTILIGNDGNQKVRKGHFSLIRE